MFVFKKAFNIPFALIIAFFLIIALRKKKRGEGDQPVCYGSVTWGGSKCGLNRVT